MRNWDKNIMNERNARKTPTNGHLYTTTYCTIIGFCTPPVCLFLTYLPESTYYPRTSSYMVCTVQANIITTPPTKMTQAHTRLSLCCRHPTFR